MKLEEKSDSRIHTKDAEIIMCHYTHESTYQPSPFLYSLHVAFMQYSLLAVDSIYVVKPLAVRQLFHMYARVIS